MSYRTKWVMYGKWIGVKSGLEWDPKLRGFLVGKGSKLARGNRKIGGLQSCSVKGDLGASGCE